MCARKGVRACARDRGELLTLRGYFDMNENL